MNDEQRAMILAARALPQLERDINALDAQAQPHIAAWTRLREARRAGPKDPDAPEEAALRAQFAPLVEQIEALRPHLSRAQQATDRLRNPDVLVTQAKQAQQRVREALAFARAAGDAPADLVARLEVRLADAEAGVTWAEAQRARQRDAIRAAADAAAQGAVT